MTSQIESNLHLEKLNQWLSEPLTPDEIKRNQAIVDKVLEEVFSESEQSINFNRQ